MKLWLTADELTQHVQIVGGTGTRKSSMIRNIVRQAVAKGWCCIFLDLKKEYLQEFYRPDKDNLIDFTDDRCVRWMIGQEAVHEYEGMAMAAGAFPDEQHRSFFFQDHAKAIATFLFAGDHERRHEVGTSKLAKWLTQPSVIDRLVRFTEHRVTLTKNAAEQRAGIFGTLNHLGRSMRWMPDDIGRKEFSVRHWDRNSHIFLSSSAGTFAALRPIQSLIFDMLLLRLQEVSGRPVLVVADEVGRFQRCPQLENAVTMQRFTGCPILMAFQGWSQLRSIYGEEVAESIMTNPLTNIIMRTQGQKSSEAASALLGMPAEIRRKRSTETQHGFLFRYTNEGTNEEFPLRPPVLPSEIQGLYAGKRYSRGFMSQGGDIVKLKIRFLPPENKQPKLVPRPMSTTYKKAMYLASKEMEIEEMKIRAGRLGYRLVSAAEEQTPDEVEPIDEDAMVEQSRQRILNYRSRYASRN